MCRLWHGTHSNSNRPLPISWSAYEGCHTSDYPLLERLCFGWYHEFSLHTWGSFFTCLQKKSTYKGVRYLFLYYRPCPPNPPVAKSIIEIFLHVGYTKPRSDSLRLFNISHPFSCNRLKFWQANSLFCLVQNYVNRPTARERVAAKIQDLTDHQIEWQL